MFQAIVTALHIAQLIHIFGLGMPKVSDTQSENFQVLTRGVVCTYLFYHICIYFSLNMRCDRILELLNQIARLERGLKFGAHGSTGFPRLSIAKRLSYGLTSTYALYGIGFSAHVRLQVPVLLYEGFSAWIKALAITAAEEGSYITRHRWAYNGSEIGPNLALSSAYIFLSVSYDVHWVLGFLLNFLSGIIFVLIFRAFYQNLIEGLWADGSKTVQVFRH